MNRKGLCCKQLVHLERTQMGVELAQAVANHLDSSAYGIYICDIQRQLKLLKGEWL